jgi:hypothetical protein
MSFRVSHPKSVFLTTTPNILTDGNLSIPGYFQQNGIPINNQFYPALSNVTGVNSVSAWQLRSHVANKEFRGCCWSPELGLFVAVSSIGTNDRVVTSPDGITWTTRDTSGANLFWRSVCWSAEQSKFIAVASDGSGQRVLDSSNGITWTLRSTPADNQWTSVIWAKELNLFVAVSQSGTGNRVMTSPDGVNWTTRTSASDSNWRSLCWSKELGMLVAVAESGNNRIMTSTNGINWNVQISPELLDYQSICWSSELGLFVAVAGTGTSGRVITSTNGINWSLRSSLLSYWNAVSWSSQLRLFVAVSQSGTRLMYSSNGINWFGVLLDTFISYNDLCWSPELGIFIYVGERNSSATTLIATSSLSDRPPTSFNVFDSSLNNINELGLWNFQSFGRGTPVINNLSGTTIIQPGNNWIICTGGGPSQTFTLPSAASWPGREIMFLTRVSQNIFSFNNDVVPRTGGAASNIIIPIGTAGAWVTLVSDGSNWLAMCGS